MRHGTAYATSASVACNENGCHAVTDRERTLRLLQRISALTGVDRATFTALAQEAEAPRAVDADDSAQETLLLLRLVRVYRALPTAEARATAVQMVEALAVRD